MRPDRVMRMGRAGGVTLREGETWPGIPLSSRGTGWVGWWADGGFCHLCQGLCRFWHTAPTVCLIPRLKRGPSFMHHTLRTNRRPHRRPVHRCTHFLGPCALGPQQLLSGPYRQDPAKAPKRAKGVCPCSPPALPRSVRPNVLHGVRHCHHPRPWSCRRVLWPMDNILAVFLGHGLSGGAGRGPKHPETGGCPDVPQTSSQRL